MTDRISPFEPDALPPAAKRVHDRILAERGYVPGPYRFWLAAPGYADRIEPVEDHLRHGVSLDERLVEIAVLVVAKHWRARYVWTSHAPAAVKAGVAAEIVEALRTGAAPDFAREDEAACHAFCRSLLAGTGVEDAVWGRIGATIGEAGIVELLGLIGLYTSVCLTMVAYRMPTKAGEPDPFA